MDENKLEVTENSVADENADNEEQTKDGQHEPDSGSAKNGRSVSLTACIWSCIFTAVVSVLVCGIYLTNRYADSQRLAVNNALVAVEKKYQDMEEQFGILFEIDEVVREHYVGEINDENLLYGAIQGYTFASGDRYMQYMSAEESKQFIDGNYGSKKGIGVRVSINSVEDTIYVYQVLKDSPAEKAGVLVGDYITAVDGTSIEELGAENATEAISGESGTAVKITVLRGSEELVLEIIRGDYEIKSVEYEMLDGKVAYFKITGLASNTPEEFKAAVEASKTDGAEKYIFDVRNNSGGYLNSVCSVLDMLLPEGPIIRWVDKDGKEGGIKSDAEFILDAPMAVIVNGSTASAGELFAAALRDYKKAVLVGETTFGKGSMQSFYNLSDGGVIKLTSSYYYPPFSDGYNGDGIVPDIEKAFEEGVDRFKVPMEEDVQLQAAIEALEVGE